MWKELLWLLAGKRSKQGLAAKGTMEKAKIRGEGLRLRVNAPVPHPGPH